MKSKLLLCLTALPVLILSSQTAIPAEINVICSAQPEWCELMSSTFEERTGVKTMMIRMSTGAALVQVRSNALNPKFDVWWGGTGDPHLQAAAENLTEAYKRDNSDLLGWARNVSNISGHRTVGIYAGALGIGYNSALIAAKGLPVPRCWKDLANPIYEGEIQIANPNSSGTAYTALSTLVQIFGEDDAFKLLAAIHKNISLYTKSGSDPIIAAARGETTIGITFMHDMVQQAMLGFPIVIVPPCEGTGYEIGSVSIIKGARNLETARRWVDFSLDPEIQSLAGLAKAFQVPSNSKATVPPEAPDLGSIKLIDYDFAIFGSSETRKRLLARWHADLKK